jgi:hypothetical protein
MTTTTKELRILDYVRVDDDRWALATKMTVAMWREAKAVAERPTSDRDLRRHAKWQSRAAAEMLRFAAKRGLPDDAVVLGSFSGTV